MFFTPKQWDQEPACAGTDTQMFYAREDGDLTKSALHLCDICPAIAACRKQADENKEYYGVFAGEVASVRRLRLGLTPPWAPPGATGDPDEDPAMGSNTLVSA